MKGVVDMGKYRNNGVKSTGLMRNSSGELVTYEKRAQYDNKRYGTVEEFLDFAKYDPFYSNEDMKLKAREMAGVFLKCLEDPRFHLMSREEQGEAVGCSVGKIGKFFATCPDAAMKEALNKSREKHAALSLDVDAALFKAAVADGGDAKHKELFYRRAENWTPSQGLEVSQKRELEGVDTAELIKGLMEGMSEGQRKTLLEGFQKGGGGADGDTGGIAGVGDTAKG